MPPAKAAILVLASAMPATAAGANLFLDLDSVTLGTARSAVQSALERQPTGESYFWSVPDVAEGTIVPRRTWRSQSGHWCRAFDERVKLADGRSYSTTGTRCRSRDGFWVVPER